MSILLATLCLNEMEWLPSLVECHRAWPGLTHWTFVEATDRVYAATNPDRVSPEGLSVDGTSEFLADLASRDPRVTYIPHGFCGADDPAQGKVEARQRYLDAAEQVQPQFVVVVDSDEVYTHAAQRSITQALYLTQFSGAHAWTFRQRHIWRPPSIADRPLFDLEVTGGYWSVPHTRAWRWEPGCRYRANHNWIEDRHGRFLHKKGSPARCDQTAGTPECIHLGFASSLASREAKHRYYVARGEGREPGRLGRRRQVYVDCRRSYETWQPGDVLPHGARVVKYNGPVPECFQQQEQPCRIC